MQYVCSTYAENCSQKGVTRDGRIKKCELTLLLRTDLDMTFIGRSIEKNCRANLIAALIVGVNMFTAVVLGFKVLFHVPNEKFPECYPPSPPTPLNKVNGKIRLAWLGREG